MLEAVAALRTRLARTRGYHGEDRICGRDLPYPHAAGGRRDAAALCRNRPENEAPRQGGAAGLDALIVFGDDQNESYREDCRPTFAIYCGDAIRNGSAQHGTYNDLPEWYIRNRAAFFEPVEPRDYPVHTALALHVVETLSE